MTFLTGTLRPSATTQVGVVTNTVTGAGSIDAALADASDSSFARFAGAARNDGEVARVTIPAPVLSGTDRVFSIGIRVRMKSVVEGTNRPLLLLWLRTQYGAVTVAGQVAPVSKTAFDRKAPTDPVTASWQDLDLGQFTIAPDDGPWSQSGNLTALSVELGRGGGDDDFSQNLDVAALYVDYYYQQVSTVTVTAPSNGADTQPTAKWTYANSTQAPQQSWRGAVYTAAQVAAGGFTPFVTPAQFTSGSVGASAATSYWQLGEDQQWVLPGDLVDGTYSVYIQASAQWAGAGGDFVTAIASRTWTRTAAPASPPATAVLDSAAYSYTDMQTYITMHPGGASPATVAYTVQSTTDGVVWAAASPSLTYVPANGMTPVVVGDRFPLLNAPTQYRVVAYAGSPLVAAASPSSALTVTPADDRILLKHPTNDLLDTAIQLEASKGDPTVKRTKRQMQGTFYFSGGPTTQVLPMMTWGPTYGFEYDLAMVFKMIEDPTLWDALDQLDEARCPLFLQFPWSDQLWGGLGPGASGRDTEETVRTVPGNQAKLQMIKRKTMFTQTSAPAVY